MYGFLYQYILLYTLFMTNSRFKEQIDYIENNSLTTPVTFFDERNLHQSLETLHEVFSKDTLIFYALKSCYNKKLLYSLSKIGVGVEVLSELEYKLAKQSGFTSIILNGMGRSSDLLSETINDGNIVIVDTITDLENLKFLANSSKKTLKLGVRLRINLSDNYPENSYVSADHPLGNYQDSDLFKQFLEFCNSKSNIKWEMIHAHIAINEFSSQIYKSAIIKIANVLQEIKVEYKIQPSIVNLGGGFEVYDPNNKRRFINMFQEINDAFDSKLGDFVLAIEPGRYLSAYAGYTIGKVLDIKKVNNKNWIITDIGTNTLIPIPNARYKLALPAPSKDGGDYKVGITDGITSPANNIISDISINALPKIGSYLCVENTGAYTDVYSTFWAYAPHKVCFINQKSEISVHRSQEEIEKLKKIFLK